ncbi:uncharacterized protein BJ212DRAFT_1296380 [Suillus subaureus]|uniref:Protein kinase domain-containing protein n=1 Tax=Suillus subaureus TaxID=48587 RepID=A0A9P7EK02_9AGAM|nr:uncharacterized protein BJ212DRAFT_1296380 [Suillus subaureus]KAG1823850.1 hypothetical protein BJ212DRAFT_1296380 [Suillus subaureus]
MNVLHVWPFGMHEHYIAMQGLSPATLIDFLDYLSPEHACGLPHDTQKSDIWSLGVTIFEILRASSLQAKPTWRSNTRAGQCVENGPMEKLPKRMIVPNADLRCTDVCWQAAGPMAVPDKHVHNLTNVSTTVNVSGIANTTSSAIGKAVCMTIYGSWSTNATNGDNVNGDDEMELSNKEVDCAIQRKEAQELNVISQVKCASMKASIDKGVQMYKSLTLDQIMSGHTTPVWCASLEPVEFEQHCSGEAGRFSYEDIHPANSAEKE